MEASGTGFSTKSSVNAGSSPTLTVDDVPPLTTFPGPSLDLRALSRTRTVRVTKPDSPGSMSSKVHVTTPFDKIPLSDASINSTFSSRVSVIVMSAASF